MKHFRFAPLLACGLVLTGHGVRAQDPVAPTPPAPSPAPAPAEPAPAIPAPPPDQPPAAPVPVPAPETPPQTPPVPEPAPVPVPEPTPAPAPQPAPAADPQAPAPAPTPVPAVPATEPPPAVPTPTSPPPQPPPAPAAITVRGVLSARTVPVGGTAVLSFRLIGIHVNQFHGPVPEISVPGLQVEYRGTSPRLLRAQGAPSHATDVNFAVTGLEAGSRTIPPQTFLVGEQLFTTEAMKVEVNDGPPVEEQYQPVAQLTVRKTEMWRGEVVPVSVAVLVHPAVQPLSQFFPQVQSDGFAVTRFDRSAGLEEELVNGELWRAWTMQSVMTPLKAGEQVFGPAEVKGEVAMPLAGSGRDQFGGFPSARKTLKLTSNTVTVNVKELPLTGRPEGFAGAVGDFRLEVTASPTELAVGESVILETRITGTGNFDALEAPALENTDGWKTYKARVSEENRGWGTEPGAKSFTQILTAEKNVSTLAPAVLHFFDPATGKYVTRKSQPIALKITGDVKPSAVGAGAADFTLAADASVPVEELNDILPQPLPARHWIVASQPLAPVNPWLLNGPPAALALLVLGAGAARRFRAAAASRGPKKDAPRPLKEIRHDLVRHGLSRFAFYGFVSEFLHAWPVHTGEPLPVNEKMAALRAARDQWLYSRTAAESAEPMPAEEQSEVRRLLAQL